jgi:IK cytokine
LVRIIFEIFIFSREKNAQKTFGSLKPKKLVGEKKAESDNEDDSKVMFKTKLGRSVFRVLFEAEPKKVNELFQPQRMAYIVDLTNEDDVDVPITSIRSKADCPSSESSTSLTTNDIVINKLTQILSYLRHGKRDAKKNKKKGAFATKFDQEKKNADSELR